jgi:hypothetical protein
MTLTNLTTASVSAATDPTAPALRYTGRVVVTRSAAARRAEVLAAEVRSLGYELAGLRADSDAAALVRTLVAAAERDARMWAARAGLAVEVGPDQNANPSDGDTRLKGYRRGEDGKGRF